MALFRCGSGGGALDFMESYNGNAYGSYDNLAAHGEFSVSLSKMPRYVWYAYTAKDYTNSINTAIYDVANDITYSMYKSSAGSSTISILNYRSTMIKALSSSDVTILNDSNYVRTCFVIAFY